MSHLNDRFVAREIADAWKERAEAAEAEVVRLKGLLHTELLCEMAYCETHELAYQFPRDTQAGCPHCRVTVLEEALREVDEVLSLCTTRRFDAPEDAEVGRLGARIGYGALISAASKEWARLYDGTRQEGSQHTHGPAELSVKRTLTMIRAALEGSVPPEEEGARERAHRAVQKLLIALHLYPGYRVDSRGPSGCLVDAIDLLEPDVAAQLREGVELRDLLDRDEKGDLL